MARVEGSGIGIRVALGARPGEVARRVQARTVAWVAMGVVVGVGIAAGVGRLASSLLYDVAPLDPAAFGAGVAVLTGVAAVAAWLPARRTAGVDPVEALRAVR